MKRRSADVIHNKEHDPNVNAENQIVDRWMRTDGPYMGVDSAIRGIRDTPDLRLASPQGDTAPPLLPLDANTVATFRVASEEEKPGLSGLALALLNNIYPAVLLYLGLA